MRFATQSQIDEIEGYVGEITAYRLVFGDLVKTLAGYIEAYEMTFPFQAGIETRYITSEGRDAEKWRGHLLAASPTRQKVNLWLLTVTMNQGLPFSKDEAVGSFDKRLSIGIDYFYDYKFGVDNENSEDFFNNKIDGFDLILERIRNCLPNDATIESWVFRRSIQQFTNASSHFAKGDLAIKISGL